MKHAPFSVVAVSGDALRPTLLDALLEDDGDYEVVFVESIERAYSRIRQLRPNLVLVFMQIDDECACRLLSMIEIDPELAGMPVVTWATEARGYETDRIASETVPDPYDRIAALTTH